MWEQITHTEAAESLKAIESYAKEMHEYEIKNAYDAGHESGFNISGYNKQEYYDNNFKN